ncbi:MAG: NFACT family protein [Candidatus Woesearchaeota archaeon]|jgi:predicted ribosome quality control (RQC) complex YloA/Tae2 family protein|nr:NFACT family protein [Candidatus Woesearchaeota archaeon]
MKTQLSSLDIHYLIKELKLLINARVDNIYSPTKKELLIQFYVSSKGKKILKVLAGKFFYLSETKGSFEEPSQFCMFLRKYLNNSRLKSVSQKESERIIELLFETKEKKLKLIIEFFSTGNILLCNKDDLILSAIEYNKWKDREVRPKVKYNYPKKDYNLFNIKETDLTTLINNSKKDKLVTALAVELGIGGLYAEELCTLSKINKATEPSEIDQDQIKLILKAVKEITTKTISPLIYYENDEVKEITPFKLNLLSKLKSKEFKTFNESLDYYFLNEYKEPKKETKFEIEIKKLKAITQKQKDHIDELAIEREENKEKAEEIYNHYKTLGNVIKEINTASKKFPWKEIKDRLKGHKLIKELNLKEKKILVEIK